MTWYRCLIFCIVLSYLHVKVSSRAETFQDVSLPIPGKEIVIELMGRGIHAYNYMQMLLRGNILALKVSAYR